MQLSWVPRDTDEPKNKKTKQGPRLRGSPLSCPFSSPMKSNHPRPRHD